MFCVQTNILLIYMHTDLCCIETFKTEMSKPKKCMCVKRTEMKRMYQWLVVAFPPLLCKALTCMVSFVIGTLYLLEIDCFL